jgi:predicted ArsR family transcriptional regulator
MPRHLTATRREILHALKKQGELTATELAECLGMTSVAVRHQLTHLQAADLVEQHVTRRPVGRPVAVYVLSSLADELFPKQYEHLATSILNRIAELDGEEKIHGIFHARATTLAVEYSAKLAGLDLEQKIERLTELLSADDAMAEWYPVEGGYELHFYNCVLSRIVSLFPQACAEELEMLQQVLGADVQRTELMTTGNRRCTYLIRPSPNP